MCGITGTVAFTEKGRDALAHVNKAVNSLHQRGPDSHGIYSHENLVLGHARLSIIDTSSAGAQPMTDESGRYTIVLNGEFFNFQEHRQFVTDQGFHLKSGSDTEVLLYLYIIEKEKCLERINGFFAFAVYDKQERILFMARDRMGIKPLYYFRDHDNFLFASEMKAMMALGIPKEIDRASLFTYLQLNYIPGPHSIFQNVNKLSPGCFKRLDLKKNGPSDEVKYYEIPLPAEDRAKAISLSYSDQQKKLRSLLDDSVKRRLISDVPLGAFLSGGIDSSVIVALASRHTPHLRTFSIGFRDEPMFDETTYAELVAKKFGTDHTVFKLTNDDLFNNLFETLDYIDEPFADSSALNVFILSRQTRKQVTVALSGDGADELFAGYNKHEAERRVRAGYLPGQLLKFSLPLLRLLPQSRNSPFSDWVRKARKLGEGMRLNTRERYWRWASFETEAEVMKLIDDPRTLNGSHDPEYISRKANILRHLHDPGELDDVLYTDMKLVMVNDMLVKVDLMSMANSLEVRVPFLDYTVVDFAFSIPIDSKINASGRKRIVRDAFRDDLPPELYNRGKKGFEVPLLKWLRNELRPLVMDDLLSKTFIEDQGIFNYIAVEELKKKLFSNNPGDSPARIWALFVFQYWWKKIDN